MTRKRDAQVSDLATIQAPVDQAAFEASVAAGKYDKVRRDGAAVGWPPRWAVGDPVEGTRTIIAEASYHLALAEEVENLNGGGGGLPGTSQRLGLGGFYGQLSPVGSGIPSRWRDGNGVMQSAWIYDQGKWKSGPEAPSFVAEVEIGFIWELTVASAKIELTLVDETTSQWIDKSGVMQVRNINTPEQARLRFAFDRRGDPSYPIQDNPWADPTFLPVADPSAWGLWIMQPDRFYSIYLTRWDTLGSANLTIRDLYVKIRSLAL